MSGASGATGNLGPGLASPDAQGTRGRGRPADVAQHRGVEKKPTAEAIEVSCRSVDAI